MHVHPAQPGRGEPAQPEEPGISGHDDADGLASTPEVGDQGQNRVQASVQFHPPSPNGIGQGGQVAGGANDDRRSAEGFVGVGTVTVTTVQADQGY